MFHHRRQSRDRILVEDLLRTVGSDRLWLAPYSAPLFEGRDVLCAEAFLDEAGNGEWCFLEDRSCADVLSKVSAVLIYRWNRHYPADLYFDVDLEKNGFELRYREEFVGSSHETITKEFFER